MFRGETQKITGLFSGRTTKRGGGDKPLNHFEKKKLFSSKIKIMGEKEKKKKRTSSVCLNPYSIYLSQIIYTYFILFLQCSRFLTTSWDYK